jgi:hypothetical protein
MYEELAADLGSLDTELKRITIREERQKRFCERQAPRASTTTAGLGCSTTAIVKPIMTASPTVRARSKTPHIEPRRPAPADATPVCWNYTKSGHFAPACPEPRIIDLKEIQEESYDSNEWGDELGKEEP